MSVIGGNSGQPMFWEVDSFLREKGYELIDLEPIGWRRKDVPAEFSSRDQIIWANAFYLRDTLGAEQWDGRSVRSMVVILLAYRLFDMAWDLLKSAVDRGFISEKEMVEVGDWMRNRSLYGNRFWLFLSQCPHFPGKGTIARLTGLISRALQEHTYGEGVFVARMAWDRKWEWI